MLLALTKTSLFQALSGSMLAKEDELMVYRQQYGAQAPQIMAQLKEMRFDMLWKDLVKFVILAAVMLSPDQLLSETQSFADPVCRRYPPHYGNRSHHRHPEGKLHFTKTAKSA